MIKNPEILEEFEKELIASEPPNYEKNMKIYEAMWREARALGVFPGKNLLEGIEGDIRIAKILHRQNTLKKCSPK